jgi:hypothetical protein
MKRAIFLSMLLAAGAVAQEQRNAIVTGVVVDSVAGRPLANYSVSTSVNVTYVGDVVQQSPQQRTVNSTTDEQGRYRLADLPPGEYRIDARNSQAGFGGVVTRHINLTGQDLEHVDFKVRILGAITGRVVDENREPVVGASVHLITREYYSGVLGYFYKDGARTDDRGNYTMKRVEAGRPYLVMVDTSALQIDPHSTAPLDSKLRRKAVVRTFYPNSPDRQGGSAVLVNPGETREGIDIEVKKAPSFCVDGTLSSLGGPAALYFNYEGDQPAYGTSSTGGVIGATPGGRTGPDGKYRICGLAPGAYRLSAADQFQGPQINRALTSFQISDRDLTNLNLTVSPGMSVQGEVLFDGPAPPKRDAPTPQADGTPVPPPPVPRVSLSLNPLLRSPVANERPNARADIPGTFSIPGLLFSDYALRPFLNSGTMYVKDITYAGKSVLYEPMKVGASAGDLGMRVLIGRDGARVSARVTDKDGTPQADFRVVVMPAAISSEAMLQAAMVTGQTNQAGQYRSQTLRPGKYFVLATDDPIDATPECIDNLWRSRAHFTEVELPPSGTAQVQLTPVVLKR